MSTIFLSALGSCPHLKLIKLQNASVMRRNNKESFYPALKHSLLLGWRHNSCFMAVRESELSFWAAMLRRITDLIEIAKVNLSRQDAIAWVRPSQLTRAKWPVTGAEERVFCILHQITRTIRRPVWAIIWAVQTCDLELHYWLPKHISF